MKWQRVRFLESAWLLVLFCVTASLPAAPPPAELSVEELEDAIVATRGKLDRLPLRLVRESGGTLGHRAGLPTNDPESSWVEIDLLENRQFDSIVVVPVVRIDERQTSANFAFPEKFQIRLYSSPEDATGELLFDSTVDALTPYPDRAPIIIDCPGSSARRIRFIPLNLHQVFGFANYVYGLSELLVFDGDNNLALGKPVKARHWTRHRPIWYKDYLNDGYMPFSEPGRGGDAKVNGSRMFVPRESEAPAAVTLDLGSVRKLDEVRLYPFQADRNHTVFHKSALGFPKRFKIEVSEDAGFSSPTVIYDSGANDYLSPGHRLACFSAEDAAGRFVRISSGRLPPHPRKAGSIFAMSEIEVISRGEVVSRGADAVFSHQLDIGNYPMKMLTDGESANGFIMPMRAWLAGLVERNRLEARLAALETELQTRYQRHSRIARWMKWTVGIALLLLLAVYFWQRHTRLRHIYSLREDLAADLHDEIGSNFSGIALLSDDLVHEPDMPPAHIPQLASIAGISRASASNARALVRFLESRNVTGKLLEEMQITAEMLLAKHSYSFDVDGYKHVGKLEPKDKWHLLLFFKEALNNIVRHAGATDVGIRLQLTPKQLTLNITDNGCGLQAGQRPSHLTMRAEKLNANVTFTAPPEGGTTINLEKPL
ncbi:hypothetical protein NT6N_33300 [Oceaniferula spumae]|uniref:histidine kinase n=1 Tax=Oceaniferula spumae TaxID=2979115 RepID=A0AAT9FQH5_9BACT